MNRTLQRAGLAGTVAALALLSLPAWAGAHAVVSPSQPQTTPLTAARTLYVLRVPNEKPKQPTYKVVLNVPAAVQEAISVRQVSDWKVRLTRKATGKKDEEGNALYAITNISWTAKKGAEIDPHFFGEFYFRFSNPATAQSLCFPVFQYYRAEEKGKSSKKKNRKQAKPEIVQWVGAPNSEFPASCVNVAAAPPAA